MPRVRALIPVFVALAGRAVAADAPTARYETTALELGSATIQELTDQGAVLRPAEGPVRRLPLSSIVALSLGTPPPTLPPLPPDAWFVELVDGQRLAVRPAPADNPDALSAQALALGPARIPLDRVARLARPGDTWDAPTPANDTVTLTNGDELTGFVASLGATVSIELTSGSVTGVPLERVASVRMANPRVPEPGTLVTDDLGITLLATTFAVAGDGALTITTQPAPLGLDYRGEDAVSPDRSGARLLALRVTGDGARVRPVGDTQPARVTPTGGRRWTPDPVVRPDADPFLGVPDVFMPAPAEGVYPLPAGADRLALRVRAEGGPWTDCVARVLAELRDGSRVQLGSFHLEGSSGAGDLSVDLPTGTRSLVFTVDPGRYGPVQDAVVFEHPRVRVAR